MKSIISIALSLTYLLSGLAFSQGTEAKTVSLKIKVLCVKKIKGYDQLTFHLPKEETLALPLYDDSFSDELKYKGPNTMSLSFNGEQQFEFTPSIQAKELVLLLIPQVKKEGQPFKIVALNNSLESFPFGTRNVINLTNTRIAFKMPNHKFVVLPKKTEKLKLTKAQVGTERFPVQFYSLTDKNWKLFSSTKWSIDNKKRTYLFFYKNPLTKQYTYHSIPDYYVDEAAVAAAFKAGQETEISEEDKKKKAEAQDETLPRKADPNAPKFPPIK